MGGERWEYNELMEDRPLGWFVKPGAITSVISHGEKEIVRERKVRRMIRRMWVY